MNRSAAYFSIIFIQLLTFSTYGDTPYMKTGEPLSFFQVPGTKLSADEGFTMTTREGAEYCLNFKGGKTQLAGGETGIVDMAMDEKDTTACRICQARKRNEAPRPIELDGAADLEVTHQKTVIKKTDILSYIPGIKDVISVFFNAKFESPSGAGNVSCFRMSYKDDSAIKLSELQGAFGEIFRFRQRPGVSLQARYLVRNLKNTFERYQIKKGKAVH